MERLQVRPEELKSEEKITQLSSGACPWGGGSVGSQQLFVLSVCFTFELNPLRDESW